MARSSEEGRTGAERVLLVLLLAAVGVPRLMMSACVTDFGPDASFYTDVAQHVRDGNGLSTDVSVFHHGFPSFPHPTSTYPLWPLLYGYAARLAPIEIVAVWLPTVLCLVALGLAYLLGRRLAPRRLFADLPFHGGHVFAALFAVNAELAIATSRPYTEGLAFLLLFGLFLRARALWRSPGLLAGLELGLWVVALFLTRSAFVVVGMAAVCTVPVAMLRRPRKAALLLLGTAASASAVWLIYLRWLATFLPHPTLGTYLRLDLARVSDRLSVVPFLYETRTVSGRILELLESLQTAFSLNGSMSYHAMSHGAAYALPAAALLLAARARELPAVWRLLRGPTGAEVAFLHLAAFGLTASLHTVHELYGAEWVFGARLGIPSLVLTGLATLCLLRSRVRLARAAGIFVLCAGLYGSFTDLASKADDQCRSVADGRTLDGYRVALRKWLEAERDRLDGLVVAVERPEAQLLAWRTPGVGFHWMTETTTVDDLVVLVTELGVRYVVTSDNADNVTFTKDPAFARRFVQVPFRAPNARDEKGARGSPDRVYAPRCSAFPGVDGCRDASP